MRKFSLALMVMGSVVLVMGCASVPPKDDDKMAFCTQEAKLCPDGVSYVGRQGPYCEFGPCPEVKPDGPADNGLSDNFKTYSDDNLSFKYPAAFGSEYIDTQSWPPKVTVADGVFACAGDTKEVNGHKYCVTSQIEGAAGSTYTTYTYLSGLETEHSILTIEFTLRLVQCENYDEPKKTDCDNDQANNLNVDALVDQIAQSVKLL